MSDFKQNLLEQFFPVNALVEYFMQNLYFLKSDLLYVNIQQKI